MEVCENRIALLGIIVKSGNAVERVNATLHDFSEYVSGRMGLPMRGRNVCAISLVLDAPVNVVNALTGKLGAIEGVSAKAMFEKNSLCIKGADYENQIQ